MTIIKHNLPVTYRSPLPRMGWYLTPTGRFANCGRVHDAARYDWSEADRWSFHEWLMGWDFITAERRGV